MTIKVNQDEIPQTVIEAKRWWRKEVRRVLNATDEDYRSRASAAIALNVLCLKEYKKADTILAYCSVGKEVGTLALISKMLDEGKKVCLPLCTDLGEDGKRAGDTPEMEARLIKSFDDLVPGAYNIPEPKADTKLVSPEEIDMILLPCVSCDTSCRRLGHGGGYYDKYLCMLKDKCFKAAVCFEAAMAEELPVEEHDMPVDAVITEESVYRWRPSR